MNQRSLAESGFELSMKRTRKRQLLEQMQAVVPWADLEALITPYAPAGKTGRPPFAVAVLLRIHVLQLLNSYSDPAMEEALHDIPLYREFCGLDVGTGRLPDESTILRFRHLLEAHDLSQRMMDTINRNLADLGLLLKTVTAVDATIIAAPSSTKNSTGTRDPEMHQTKKGNQWHFGMKAHIGVDAELGLVHSVIGTAANVHDVTQGHALLHGQESSVFADAGYQGADKRPEANPEVDWQVAMRPGKRRAVKHTPWGVLLDQAEKLKASVRAIVEHPFRVVKCQFGLRKVKYRGLAKNTAHLKRAFALSNLWMARHKILAMQG